MAVLYKEMLEVCQGFGVSAAVPLEEQLVVTEYGRYAEYLDVSPVESPQEIGPELVFDKESLLYLDAVQESLYVERSVKRYVADNVGSLVVFAYLIA